MTLLQVQIIIMINNKSNKAKTSLQKIIQENIAQLRRNGKLSFQEEFGIEGQSQQQAQELFNQTFIQSENKPKQSSQESQSDSPEQQQQQVKLETKIKSILKSSQFKTKIEEKSKRVSFSDSNQKEQKEKDYIVIGTSRRWNQKLKDHRKGKFDPQQRRILIQNLHQCLAVQNLTYDSIVKSMSEDDQKIPRNLQFWTKVCSILPDRSIVSSYKFLKRQLSTKNKGGDWSNEQVELLEQLVRKYGRKWSMIAKEMRRTSENIRDKYRLMGQQKYDPSKQQTVWKLEQLVKYLRFLQKHSKLKFLKEQIQNELKQAEKHDEIELKQMKQRRYNSKTFNFHNNQVVRKYIRKQFNEIKIEQVNWQKISDQIGTKTIFDCRNKFVQLLQLQIYGMGSKQFYEKQICKFIITQKPKTQNEILWGNWRNQQINIQQAKNRWMILKRHIQGRGQKTFSQLLELIKNRFNIN